MLMVDIRRQLGRLEGTGLKDSTYNIRQNGTRVDVLSQLKNQLNP